MSDKLVAYISCTGTTRKVAEAIAKETGADIFEIRPAKPYSPADLNWKNDRSRSTLEMNDRSSRPEMEEGIDVSGYSTVYLGFPIWWYDAPRIISTFLESGDFSGKHIAVFVTSGSSDVGKSADNLRAVAPGAVWGKAERFSSADPAWIRKWLASQ